MNRPTTGQFREARKQDPTEGKYSRSGGLASFPSKKEQSKRNANRTENALPTPPRSSPSALSSFFLSFSFSFVSPFFLFRQNEHEEPALAAHNTLARLSLLSGLGLTFQKGPGAFFLSACLFSKVCDVFAQGSCSNTAPNVPSALP